MSCFSIPTSIRAAAALGLAALAAAPAAAEVITLFDVDFNDEPFFQLPEESSAGVPRQFISHISLGDPLVQPEYGDLDDIPLVFEGGDQVRIWPFQTPEATWYDLSFNVQAEPENNHYFVVDVLAPNVRRLLFDTEVGQLWIMHSDGSFDPLGDLDYSVSHDVRIVVDREFNALIVYVDGEERFRGFNDTWGPITQVAFGAVAPDFDEMSGAIDNIVFRASLPNCPADVNDDRTVDLTDLLGVLSSWDLQCSACDEDVNGSGDVTLEDLLVVLASWGTCDG